MTEKGFHVAGVTIAIIVHAALGAGLLLADGGCLASASARIEEPRYVEAALAIKGQEEEPETQQPQKPREQIPAPEPAPDPISKDAERIPEPKPKPEPEPKPEPRPQPTDDFDPLEVLERNRRLAEDDTADRSGVPREDLGAITGSEWGTERDARGDPYVGELAGRVRRAWSLPSFERTADLVAWGCVRLADDGRIVHRELVEPSGSATLDRSVSVALERATDMEEPVPDHLRELLVRQGICFTFRP
jgi:periplasmic protein TonB